MSKSYNPRDWYWTKQDGTVFSSRRIATVATADPEFQAFLAEGGFATPFPRDEAGQDSVAELQLALDPADLHASLEHLAGGLRWAAVEALLVPVTLGVKTYRFQGDDASQAKIERAITLGERFEAQPGNAPGSYGIRWITADGYTDHALPISELVTVGLAVGFAVQDLYAHAGAAVDALKAGTLTTRDEVEAWFAPA